MPDETLVLKSLAAAAVAAAVVVLLIGWPWRSPRPALFSAGSALGVGAGIAAGAWVFGALPRYPPPEDQDRLLLIVLPAAVLAEIIAAALARWPWAAWIPRIAIAAVAARVLLHGTVYLTPSGPDPPKWSPSDASLIFGGLALLLAVEWVLLDWLATREAHRGVTISLAMATLAAGVAVVFSGYLTGGQLGVPFAAALVAVALASLCFKVVDLRGAIGVGLIALYSLVAV